MSSRVPNRDGEALPFLQAVSAYVTTNAAALGLQAADATPLTAAVAALAGSMTMLASARNTARSATQAKNSARSDAQAKLRLVLAKILAKPDLAEAQRASLGLSPKDTVKTMLAMQEQKLPRPEVSVDLSQRLQHTLRFKDELGGKARPKGALGVQVWMKIDGPMPSGPEELSFVDLATRAPLVISHEGKFGGKMAYYMLRYVGKDGAKGPWSELAMATIAA